MSEAINTQEQASTRSANTLRTARWRLALCMFAMFILPLILAAPLMGGFLAMASTGDFSVEPSWLLINGSLTAVLVVIVFWMMKQVLKPAEELAVSHNQLGEQYEDVVQSSLQDYLTGLGNHRHFQEEMQRMIGVSKRDGQPLSLLLFDLDDFKLVNDGRGHAVGDQLLATVGRLVHTSMRHADRAFRIGGDEFAILMPGTSAADSHTAGRRLLAQTLQPVERELIVDSRGKVKTRNWDTTALPPVSFSGGVSTFPEIAKSNSDLYQQADIALYRAKQHGRTEVEIYDPSRDVSGERAVTAELTAAVARTASDRLLRPVYQPIIDVATREIIGFEGLVRPTEESDFSNPSMLFEAAEQVGKTTQLDRACLDVVAAAFTPPNPEHYLTLNVSPRTIEAPEFTTASITNLLTKHQLDPRRVVIELTEREAVEDVERLRNNLQSLQAAGMRIAADDVGAGNAGLRLLSQIKFDIVKIDLSLVQQGPFQETSMAVLRALMDLATRWGSKIVAEGIETEEQLEMVRNLGIGAAQGYLFGKPESLANVSATVDAFKMRMDAVQQMTAARNSSENLLSFLDT